MTIQPQTSTSPGAHRANGASLQSPLIDGAAEIARFLDKAIPLKGVSHCDIVGYGVHTPFRYSECYAVTGNGEKIGFANKHCFRGWSGRNPITSLLFQYGDSQLELMLLSDRAASGPVADINLVHGADAKLFNENAYIGLSGAPI